MKHPRATLLLPLVLLTSACSHTTSSNTPPIAATSIGTQARAALPSLPTIPVLRTDGDLPKRHEQIVAEVSKGGHEICFLGASIIEFWAKTGKENWNAVWAPRHAVDCGIGGDRTQHVLARLDNGLLDALAAPSNNIRGVVMNIGSNNTDVDTGGEIAEGTIAIIEKLHARLPSARIILIGLFPRGRWPNPLRDTIRYDNLRMAEYAAGRSNYFTFIDIGEQFLTPQGELPAERMPDFLHPVGKEYEWVSEEVLKVMK